MHMYLHQVNLNLFLEIYKYDIPVFGPGFFWTNTI
jgi:hypothetical protein